MWSLCCRSSLVEFLGLLIDTIISSTNSDALISYLLLCIPLIPFCCLITLATTLGTILNRYWESSQPCPVPDFSGMSSSISPFNLVSAVGLLYIAFMMFKYGP